MPKSFASSGLGDSGLWTDDVGERNKNLNTEEKALVPTEWLQRKRSYRYRDLIRDSVSQQSNNSSRTVRNPNELQRSGQACRVWKLCHTEGKLKCQVYVAEVMSSVFESHSVFSAHLGQAQQSHCLYICSDLQSAALGSHCLGPQHPEGNASSTHFPRQIHV